MKREARSGIVSYESSVIGREPPNLLEYKNFKNYSLLRPDASGSYHLFIYKTAIHLKLCLPALGTDKKLHFISIAVFNFPFNLPGSRRVPGRIGGYYRAGTWEAGIWPSVVLLSSLFVQASMARPRNNVSSSFFIFARVCLRVIRVKKMGRCLSKCCASFFPIVFGF